MTAERILVDVGDHLADPGSRRPHHAEVQMPGLAISTSSVPDAEPVELDLYIESIGDEVVVEGHVRSRWHGECRRCLDLVSSELDVEVREIFERHPVEGDTYLLGDPEAGSDVIDLAPMVRDVLVLALPLAPLCSAECAGPDPERFPAVPGEHDASAERTPDPRWAALDQLRREDLPEGND